MSHCGNPLIMTGRFAGALKPDLALPFKGKPLLLKVFKAENQIKEENIL